MGEFILEEPDGQRGVETAHGEGKTETSCSQRSLLISVHRKSCYTKGILDFLRSQPMSKSWKTSEAFETDSKAGAIFNKDLDKRHQ